MNKSSEAFDSARSEYIEGCVEKKEHIFPTLSLIAKEFKLSLSTLRKKAANESWHKKRKHHQNSQDEFEMRKQFKGKYSKLAQVSRNTLVFVEYFQNSINKEIEGVKRGEKIHTTEDTARLVNGTVFLSTGKFTYDTIHPDDQNYPLVDIVECSLGMCNTSVSSPQEMVTDLDSLIIK